MSYEEAISETSMLWSGSDKRVAQTNNQPHVERLKRAATREGRGRLRAHAQFKRLKWQCHWRSGAMAKRAMDITIASSALLAFLPFGLIIAGIIKLDGGPIFFGQERVGRYGKHFKMWKFRSMKPNAEKLLKELLQKNEKRAGITFKIKRDPRITRIGRILRKLSLDEMPQLINILKGDMSLVGPRPALPREVKQYKWEHRKRLETTPGLTCLWQVGERNNGLFEVGNRNHIDFPEQVELDIRYIENQTLRKDVILLIKTGAVITMGCGM